MLRLMIVIDTYRVGGPGKVLLDFCDAVRGRVEPLLVVFERSADRPREFRDACARRGLTVQVLYERGRFDRSLMSQGLEAARALGPDLIQTHGYKADVIGFVARRRLGLPWVAFSHGWTDEGLSMRCYHAIDDLVIRRADTIVTVSTALRRAFEAQKARMPHIVTVHNSIRMPAGAGAPDRAIRGELGLRESGPVVGAIGRLSPEKGHAYFLPALERVRREHPEVQGLLVGDGPEAARLRHQALELGLADAVRFAGYRTDMERVYPALDVVVLPSLSEGLPNVALEAMAHGRALVATRVGGVPEAVEANVEGVLVPPADAPALARAVARLLRSPAEREQLATAARERVRRDFSVEARANKLLDIYASVLGAHAARAGAAPPRARQPLEPERAVRSDA